MFIHYFNNEQYFLISDLNLRSNLNDFFLNNYFYFWTSFWYIPTSFIVLTSIIYFFNINKYFISINILLILILLLYIFRLTDYWNTNIIPYFFFKNSELINLLLLNSINKYHPILLYFTITTYVIIVLSLTNYINFRLKWVFNTFNFSNKNNQILNLIIITFTLFLGSWWALQEGSWGGWWNWDPSEIVGLFIMTIILKLLHKKPKNYYFYWYYNYLLLWILIMLYTFTQLNFNLISHNFGLKSPEMKNHLTIFYNIMFITIILFILSFYKLFTYILQNINYYLNTYNFYLRIKFISSVSLFFIILLIIFYSFSLLINNFFLKIFYIVNLPLITNDMNILTLSLIISLLFYLKITIYNSFIFIYCFLIKFNPWLYVLIIILFKLNRVNYIHIIVWLFIIINILNKFYTYFFRSKFLLNNITLFLHSSINILPKNFIINSTTLEMSHLKFLDLKSVQSGVTVFLNNTTSEIHELMMFFSFNNTLQILTAGKWNKLFFMSVIDYQVVNILTLLCIFIIYTYFYFYNKKLIIF